MTKLFVPERKLKDVILSQLRDEELSISGMKRMLDEKGFKYHKLHLAGYLQALKDLGILKEKNIPPSKVYSVATSRDRNLYEYIGEEVRSVKGDTGDARDCTCYVLQKLFQRPIFMEELRECGFNQEPPSANQVKGEERREARRYLSRSNFWLPYNDPAYMIKEGKDADYDGVMRKVLLSRFSMQDLVHSTKQLKLD